MTAPGSPSSTTAPWPTVWSICPRSPTSCRRTSAIRSTTVQDEIIAGTFAPFTGPINDQDGNEKVAAGEVPDLGTLLGMDYFVAGVIGSATG